MIKTVLSLFDSTGNWCRPFEQAGWNVVQLDLSHGDDIRELSAKWFLEGLLQQYPTIDGILAAPPCTDFARSGATHWARKDADGTTAAAVELVYQTLRAVDFLQPDFWVVENPVGRIERLVPELGGRRLIFDPCEYGGWTGPDAYDLGRLDALATMTPEQMGAEDVELVKRVNAYTKKTILWGNFRQPEKKPVPAIRTNAWGSWLMSYGGKSARTKAARSVTPEGFARAFAAAQLAV